MQDKWGRGQVPAYPVEWEPLDLVIDFSWGERKRVGGVGV